MRILFASARETTYARNEVLLRALRNLAEVDVIAPESAPASLVKTSMRVAWRALGRLRRQEYDLIFCGFYGYLIAQAVGRAFVRGNTPLLFDAFVSNHDTLVQDRGAISPRSLRARVALWLDRSTCALADGVLIDTHAHADYFATEFAVPPAKLTAIPVGCSEEIFYPAPHPLGNGVTVLYYCSYQPLHGVDIVLRAAAMLQPEELRWRLVGNGPLREEMEALAKSLGLTNVEFLDAVSPTVIAEMLRASDICLGGHFGASGKAQRTIPGKVYQMLAAERAAICADSVANRELLVDGDSALLVPSGDPDALAEAVRRLYSDAELRERIARGGRRAYEQNASEAIIGAELREVVARLTMQPVPLDDAGTDAVN